MGWRITYNTLESKCVDFNSDKNLNCPTFRPNAKTAEEAIRSIKEHIAEIYACNCISTRVIPNGLEMIEPSDNEVVERYTDFSAEPEYHLIGKNGKPYLSSTPGLFGGHKRLKIYGKLDCPSANRAIAKGQYVKYRVFFASEEDAVAAGYRPCANCMPKEYKQWKEARDN